MKVYVNLFFTKTGDIISVVEPEAKTKREAEIQGGPYGNYMKTVVLNFHKYDGRRIKNRVKETSKI